MKLRKRIISFLLIICMTMAYMPVFTSPALAADEGVTTTLPAAVDAGDEVEFTVSTTGDGSETVLGKIETTATDFTLWYWDTDSGSWLIMPGDTFGPASTGFPMGNVETKFKVKFAHTGDFDVKIKMVRFSDSSVVAECSKNISVNSTVDATGATLTAVPADPDAGANVNLTLSGVKDAVGNNLTVGSDYTVTWQYSMDGMGFTDMKADDNSNTYVAATPIDPGSTVFYRAVVKGKGNISGTETVDATIGVKQIATTTALSVKQNSAEVTAANEQSEVLLEAVVNDANDNELTDGTVTYFADGAAIATVPAGSSASYTLPERAAAEKVTFSATYTGTTSYKASASADVDVNVNCITIKGDGVILTSTAILQVGVEGTLKLDGAVKDTAGNTLTAGTDYTVKYYQNKNGNSTWTELADEKVTPESANDTFYAKVEPKAPYKLGGFETSPIGGVELASSTTTIDRVSSGDIYQNDKVAYTATVTDGTNPVVGGTVSFYYYKDDDTDNKVFVDTVSVVDGTATCNVSFPDATTADNKYNVLAVYSGNNAYKSSKDTIGDQVVKSNTLDVKAFISTPTNLVVDTDGTLTLKLYDVLSFNTDGTIDESASVENTSLTANDDYIIVWQQSNGAGWFEVQTGGSTLNVKPTSSDDKYRVLILPNGDYKNPATGITSNAIGVEKATSKTELTVDAAPVEGDKLILKAHVSSGTVAVPGIVEFYQDSTFLGQATINSEGDAYIIVTAPAYGTEYLFKAEYLGDDSFSGSNDTKTVKPIAAQIVTAGNSRNIDVAPAVTKLTVGENYTLTIPTVYRRDTTTPPLTVGVDYDVTWQVSNDGGNTWNDLGSYAGNSITVTPETNNSQYRAVIAPKGSYSKAYDGTEIVDFLTMNAVSSQTVATTTTLTASPAGVKEGQEVNLSVEVKDVNGNYAEGSVKIYHYVNGTADELVGTISSLDALGKGNVVVTAPAFGTANTHQYYAIYSGNESFAPSGEASNDATKSYVAEIVVASDKIMTKDDSKTITVKQGTSDYTGDLIANTTYKLTIPDVYQEGTTTKLTNGSDYKVAWQVSVDGGETWNAITNTEDSITVTPDQNGCQYRAIITPAGEYTRTIAGGVVGTELVMDVVKSQTVATTTTLAVSNTAGKYGTETLDSQYEGQKVTLTATVKETVSGSKATEGYVYFFQDGVQINTIPAEITDGVAKIDVVMTNWSATNTGDTFTATYQANDTYSTSTTAKGVEIAIRSAKLAVPTVKVDDAHITTYSTGVDGLLTATPYTFTMNGAATATDSFADAKAHALDGRVIDSKYYAIQWQKQDESVWVDVAGANNASYALPTPYGEAGDTYRLVLTPADGSVLTAGSISQTVAIGSKLDATHAIDVTKPYSVGDSHYGDKVTLTATITGTASLPLGSVDFYYATDATDLDGSKVLIGSTQDIVKKAGANKIATASIDTTELPINVNVGGTSDLVLFYTYSGDSTYNQVTANSTNVAKTDYKVWSVQIANNADTYGHAVTITAKDTVAGTAVVGAELTAGTKYTLTLDDTDIYTESGENLGTLIANGKYTVTWEQQTAPGEAWQAISAYENKKECVVIPANTTTSYRAVVTATNALFAAPYNEYPSRNDVEVSNVFTTNIHAVAMEVTTSMKDAAAPYTDSVYEGNEITLTAEISPVVNFATDPTGTVQFYYSVDGGAEKAIKSVSSTGTNNATVTKYIDSDSTTVHYYATITTDMLPANDDGKMQDVTIIAKYLGDSVYNKQVDSNKVVKVYSSKIYSDATAENVVLDETTPETTPTTSTAGIIIYAPDDVLVSDGSKTVLTLKPIYTLDAQDGTNPKITDPVGDFANLALTTNYTIQWEQTNALNEANPSASSWQAISGANSTTVEVSPSDGCAYRAVITAKTDAERTIKSEQTYYSNVLKATQAEAVLQLRATPASSAGYKDTDLVFDAYVSGGNSAPVGDIKLEINGTLGATVVRNATAVNGTVRFGADIGDTKGAINLPADVYTVTATYTGNNGYSSESHVENYIVRYKAEEIAVEINDIPDLTYNGAMQRVAIATVKFNGGTGHTAAQALADKSVVFNYEMKNAEGKWVPVDGPADAGEYRVTATLPQSIYYEAQTGETVEFTIDKKAVDVKDIIAQAKVYDKTTDVNVVDVQLDGVVAGDSLFAIGTAETAKADALVENEVTYTATELGGADASNYKIRKASVTEPFTIARNQLTVDSSAITTADLKDLVVYDQYGTKLTKGTGYNVAYYFHDGSGVKLVANTQKDGKYTIVIKPVDTENYKGGESFVMNKQGSTITFAGNDTVAPAQPGVIEITNTQMVYTGSDEVTLTASNGAAATATYNTTVDKAGRYAVTATADACNNASGILTVVKAEPEHQVPYIADKVYDGKVVDQPTGFPDGTYFTYTGGEIVGVSYDAPKDVGVYTVTAHVPATDKYVAYSETSTFEITQKPITVSAIAITKEAFKTQPALRATVDGLVEGDSDVKDFIAMPSFDIASVDGGGNVDMNTVGSFVITPSKVISRNYVVTSYETASLKVQATDPNETMTIVGLPNGQVYYGDEFQVSLYGTNAKRADNDTKMSNNSSVINYYVSDPTGVKISNIDGYWSKDNHHVTINNDGYVSIRGNSAEDFTILATRGTGDYTIYTTIDVSVELRPINITMDGIDTDVYNANLQNVKVDQYSVTGTIGGDVINLTLDNFDPKAVENVGDYIIKASYTDYKYTGVGKGLKSITPATATVTTGTTDKNYGAAPVVPGYAETDNLGKTVLTDAKTLSDNYKASDVGEYEAFTAGVVNPNFVVIYKSGKVTVNPKPLTVNAGVDTSDNTFNGLVDTLTYNAIDATKVEREYGVVNPIMGYQVDGLIDGDSLADLLVSDEFVAYGLVQESDANRSGADDRAWVNGHTADDNYGKIDIADATANINNKAENYKVITLNDGVLDIFQKNITVDVRDLSVASGVEITNDSYCSIVNRVLTEAPMNDKIADLGLTYAPVGTSGTAPCVNNADITVALKTGTAADPQNYYRTNSTQTGTLYINGKIADANVSATKDSVFVKTTVDLIPVYTFDGTDYNKADGIFVKASEVTGTENTAGYTDVAGAAKYTIDADGKLVAATTPVTAPFVKVSEKTATKVNVGDVTALIIDENGNKVGEVTITADTTKPGEYSGAINPALNNGGTYYVSANVPTGDGYNLNSNTAKVTVSTPPAGGGGGGGGSTPDPTPVLEKDDHFAFMQGDQFGNFRPNDALTRAEAAQIFYNLLVEKTKGNIEVSFSDVSDDAWYAEAINTLASWGIINGKPGGIFAPNDNITRAEFAAIACRFDELTEGTANFTDVPESHWAYTYIAFAASKGWVTGYPDGSFGPNDNITRAEVVTMVDRVLERVPDEAYIDAHAADMKSFGDVTSSHWAYYYIVEATTGHNYTKDDTGHETWTTLK